jgi:hypothetical protein
MQKRKKTKKQIKVQDLKPKKDAKGGFFCGPGGNPPKGNPPKGAGPLGLQ